MIRDEKIAVSSSPAGPSASTTTPAEEKWLYVSFIRDMFENKPFIRHEYSEQIGELNEILSIFLQMYQDIKSVIIIESGGASSSTPPLNQALQSKLLQKLCDILDKILNPPVAAIEPALQLLSNSQNPEYAGVGLLSN
jgi:hypothetical protein